MERLASSLSRNQGWPVSAQEKRKERAADIAHLPLQKRKPDCPRIKLSVQQANGPVHIHEDGTANRNANGAFKSKKMEGFEISLDVSCCAQLVRQASRIKAAKSPADVYAGFAIVCPAVIR